MSAAFDVLHLKSGYSRPEWSGTRPFRRVTIAELLRPWLDTQGEWHVLGDSGDVLRARTNGALKRWKRSPTRLRLPMKYGMYEYFAIETTGREAASDFVPRLLIPLGDAT